MRYIIKNENELSNFAGKIKPEIKKGSIILLEGELGVGKTALVKEICYLFGIDPNFVKSPSFSIHNIYEMDDILINHYDLYRLMTYEDLDFLNIFEDIEKSITFIEWGKKFLDYFAEYDPMIIKMVYNESDLNMREIFIEREREGITLSL